MSTLTEGAFNLKTSAYKAEELAFRQQLGGVDGIARVQAISRDNNRPASIHSCIIPEIEDPEVELIVFLKDGANEEAVADQVKALPGFSGFVSDAC